MEDISDRFEDISFDAGPIQSKERKIIKSFVPFIEHSFEEHDKVSFSFLFIDNVQTCLDVCKKCVDNFSFSFMSDVLNHKHFNWCDKFIECVYYLQHFQLLKKLGFKEYELGRHKFPKDVPSYRLLLYRICENLSNTETLKVMESMKLYVSPEKYLEIFILKILLLDNGLIIKYFILSCCVLKNPVINKLVGEITEDPYIKICCKGNLTLPKSVNVSDDGIYPIKDPENVGLCFIVNEVNFKGLPERLGSSEDVSLLISTLQDFKFTVKNFTDVKENFFNDLNKTIDIHFKKKNYSVFFLVIMTHGEEDVIFTSEEQRINISIITSKLICPSLFKIPKVLMIQACQGPYHLLKAIHHLEEVRGLQISECTARRRLNEHGLMAFPPVRGPELTRTHSVTQRAFAQEHKIFLNKDSTPDGPTLHSDQPHKVKFDSPHKVLIDKVQFNQAHKNRSMIKKEFHDLLVKGTLFKEFQEIRADIATDGPSSVSSDQPREKRRLDPLGKTHVSDLLIAMSTIKGFKAYRHETSGSFFLQSFCKCMRAHEDECIYSIMTETIRQVKKELSKPHSPYMQQPEIRSLLERKLYLKPKIKINN